MLAYTEMREVASNTDREANQFRPVDYIKITVFGFALSALWSSLNTVILPIRLLDFVPGALKNTYLDLLILTGLILAMAVQPIAGAISDQSTFSWGRRRPYILLGTLLAVLFLPGIGFFGSYAAIFVIYCLIQISSNTAQGPYQGFIPDLVPREKRGLASGVRSLLSIGGGVALVRVIAPFMDRYFTHGENGWLWLALGLLALVLLGTMLATQLTVKEKPGPGSARLSLLTTFSRSFRIDVKAHPDFILFLVGCLFIFMGWSIVMAHALYYLMDVVHIAKPAEAIGDLLITVGGSMLVVVYPAGHLCDRVGRKLIAVSSGFLGALGILALFFSRNYPQIMLSGVLLGICSGAWMSSQWALATDLVSKGEEARYLGLVNMCIAGASALCRRIGPLIDFCNTYSPNLGYQIMLLICFVSLTIGSLLLVRIKAPG